MACWAPRFGRSDTGEGRSEPGSDQRFEVKKHVKITTQLGERVSNLLVVHLAHFSREFLHSRQKLSQDALHHNFLRATRHHQTAKVTSVARCKPCSCDALKSIFSSFLGLQGDTHEVRGSEIDCNPEGLSKGTTECIEYTRTVWLDTRHCCTFLWARFFFPLEMQILVDCHLERMWRQSLV